MLTAPADSPATVTRSGLPPNPRMFALHPAQRRQLVEQPVVARRVVARFPGQQRVGEEPERARAGS